MILFVMFTYSLIFYYAGNGSMRAIPFSIWQLWLYAFPDGL